MPTSVQAEQGEQDRGSVTGNHFRLFLVISTHHGTQLQLVSDKRPEYMLLSILQLYSVGRLINAE